MENTPLSLFQLLGQVKSTLKNSMPYAFWVIAEISEMKVNYSGHCYLELIEKDPAAESIKAKARATIWSSVYRMIQPYFETTTKSRLSAGMKIMVKVTAEFHELFGFSLNITDIEPSYTLGDMARQKQEIISRLTAEGVFDMNRTLELPSLPRKIAVISSKSAAGFGDFMDQLNNNAFGYKFYVRLFPAVMQGEEAEQSIIAALDAVFIHEQFFDLVVIIRGGGAQSELNCFNSYWLAYHICQFPLPILTGIGHEQDETIADLVAHTRLKTPTAVAEFLIGLFREADSRINELSLALTDAATECVYSRKTGLQRYLLSLKPSVRRYLSQSAGRLGMQGIRLGNNVRQTLHRESAVLIRRSDHLGRDSRQLLLVQAHKLENRKNHFREFTLKWIEKEKHALELRQHKCRYLNPFLILKRGYSVTYFRGKALKDPAEVPGNSDIETRLEGGVLKSKTT